MKDLFLILTLTIAVVRSSPVSRRDVLHQLLSTQEDFLAAKQIMDLMKAHQQGVPIPSTPYHLSLPSQDRFRGEARVTKQQPKDMIRSSIMRSSAHAQSLQDRLLQKVLLNTQGSSPIPHVVNKESTASPNIMKTLLNVVNYFLLSSAPRHMEDIVGKEQEVGDEVDIAFNGVDKTMKTNSEIHHDWAKMVPKDLKRIFIALKVIFRRDLNTEQRDSFADSIKYFIYRFLPTKIDNLRENPETKEAMKKAIENAKITLVPVFVKQLRGEKQNPEDRNKILRSKMTLLGTFNAAVTNDTTLLQTINQFLLSKPTEQDLMIKSQCLPLPTLKSFIGYYILNTPIELYSDTYLELSTLEGIFEGLGYSIEGRNIEGACKGFYNGLTVNSQEENKKTARFSLLLG